MLDTHKDLKRKIEAMENTNACVAGKQTLHCAY
jgi:hypothetical protein